jgi:Ca2+/Na+ antiporter
MKQKSPFTNKMLLWWVAIIALVIAGLIYYLMGEKAAIDPSVARQRLMFPLVGIVIAGTCLIAGTAERWFK